MTSHNMALVLLTVACAASLAIGDCVPFKSHDELQKNDEPYGAGDRHNSGVDYVVIGGGPAGMVIVEQLSQDPKVNIILLEAGPDGTTEPL